MYSDYLAERAGKKLIENDNGFLIYSISKEIVYIEDIYIVPHLRKSGHAKQMADFVVEIAKRSGCKKLLGSIVPSANGSHSSMLVLLAYGMKVSGSNYDIVYFQKDI